MRRFPVAIAARMLVKRTVERPGIVPPEDAITGPLYASFLEELGKPDIRVEETVTVGAPGRIANEVRAG